MVKKALMRNSEHEEVFLSLPWYVNGSLDIKERQHVQIHLSACEVCRAEMEVLGNMLLSTDFEARKHMNVEADLQRTLANIEDYDSNAINHLDKAGLNFKSWRSTLFAKKSVYISGIAVVVMVLFASIQIFKK